VTKRPPPDDAAKPPDERSKNRACSFCGRVPPQYRTLVGDKVRICNHCVEKFHKAIHDKGGG
jgi:hypothetical protein